MSVPFPETQWSQILALQRDGDATTRAARRRAILERLIGAYWSPAYHYIRALERRAAGDAEDLTQQFFAMLLDRGDLDRLSSERGSFRGFLKTAIRHFVASHHRAERVRPQPFAFADAEARWADQNATDPDQAFDREWIHLVLSAGLDALRGELEAAGKGRQYQIFHDYCLVDDDTVSYQGLAEKHGTNLDDVRNGLRASRQRLREIVRKRLREYLGPSDDIDAELRFILTGS